MIKTPNRFGFTGTLPKDQYDVWKILGIFGPLLFEKNSKELRDDNVLTDVMVKMILLNHRSKDIPKKNKSIIRDAEKIERNVGSIVEWK